MSSEIAKLSLWLAVALVAASCRGEQTRSPAPAVSQAASNAEPESGSGPRDPSEAMAPAVDAGGASAAATPLAELSPASRSLLVHLSQGRISRARPISHRSLSLKLSLQDGPDAVFKPLRQEDRTARHEVAAFRLSRLLGLAGVPPSTMRRIPIDNFAWMLGEQHADVEAALRAAVHLDERSGVWGATIAWIDDLEPSGLEGIEGRRRLKRWLAVDGPSAEAEPLVVDASSMVVFDYVIGNWDRLSGGNLFLGPDRGLVLLDNNGAFSRWSETKQQRMDELLGDCRRFSRNLVRALRSLDAPTIEQALAAEPWQQTRRLLSLKQVERVLERRDAVLAAVDRLVAEHGESKVLAFP